VDWTFVAALEVAPGPGERELSLFGVHHWQFSEELFSPRSFEDPLALALLAVPVDE
jgi:hypothetical protein